jgi:type VI secretion system secreted protein VgrG
MGWTSNTSRRRERVRRRPQLEALDDRCLLSTGMRGHLAEATPALRDRAAGHVRGVHAAAMQGRGARPMVRHHVDPSAARERPAGLLSTSAAGGYDSAIGASRVQSTYNVNGAGMTVAVIDTGVDYNNPGLGGGFGAGSKVVAGYDFSTNSGDPIATTSQHGTSVAGLIASGDAAEPGVAPAADIVALKVTDASNTASLDSIARALQWVVDNHAQYNITVVNLSLSDGKNYSHNWFATTGGTPEQVTNLIGQLRAIGIPVVVATGNNFDGHTQGEGFAAIVQGAISVTATAGHLDRRRVGDRDRRPGRRLHDDHGQRRHRRGGRNELRRAPGQRLHRPAPADLPAAIRRDAQRRSNSAMAPAGLRRDQRPGHRHHDRPARRPQGGRADPQRHERPSNSLAAEQ